MRKKNKKVALSDYVQIDKPDSVTPETGIFVSGIRDDYQIDDTLRRITPAKMGQALRDAEKGQIRDQYEIFELIEQDPHVASVVGKRRDAIMHLPIEIRPSVTTDDSDGDHAKVAADLCRDIIFGSKEYSGIQNLTNAIFDLTDGICKGFAVSQIVWENVGGKWTVPYILRWPQSECCVGSPDDRYAQQQDDIRILTDDSGYTGVEPDPYQWIIFQRKAFSVPIARAALFRTISWFYLLKKTSAKDWSIFIERYGMPSRVGKYPSGASEGEKNAILQAIRGFGKDAYCIVPDGMSIELIQASFSGAQGKAPYAEMMGWCNDEISKAVLGNTMTTDQGDRGARSLGEVYERSEMRSIRTDAVLLAQCLRRDLLTPIVRLNLGDDYPIPILDFVLDKPGVNADLAERDVKLYNINNKLYPISYFRKTYGIPDPQDGEELMDGSIAGEEEDFDANRPPTEEERSAMAEALVSRVRRMIDE